MANNVFAIVGDPGSGKTAFAIALLYEAQRTGRPVIANQKEIYFPYRYMPFSEVAKLDNRLRNAYINMDELGRGADSYHFFRYTPGKLGKLFTELRKRECVLFYTTQRMRLIALRLRDLTDWYFIMEDYDREKDHSKEPCAGLHHVTVLNDIQDYITDYDFYSKPYWELYNHQEVIEDVEE